MINIIKYKEVIITETIKKDGKRLYVLDGGVIIGGKDLKSNGFIIYCGECDKPFFSKNMKTHYTTKKYACNSCNKTGNLNPFFGKTHDTEFKKKTKQGANWNVVHW